MRRRAATASSSARSRTSTRWASTPATRGRWRRSRRCRTRSTSASARPPSPARGRSGVATGGANVQFAYEPETGELRVIEMNPRVSRSSALASKATGFPIAKLAALLAVGYTLDELPNDITGKTTAAFEPALDYVAVKAPRFDFEKFPARRGARHRDARRRRGARARPHVPRGVPEGARGPRGSPRPTRPRARGEPVRRALGLAARGGAAGARPARASTRTSRPSWRRSRPPSGSSPRPATSPPRSASGSRTRRRARARARRGGGARAAAPGRLAVDSCAAEFEARTPYFYLSYEAGDERAAPAGARDRRARRRARTGSARGSSSTTAACTRRRRSGGSATRRCSSTRTRRRSRPTTTRPTGSTSSR